ncbi:MAG TPA: WecB/TagA/CpsF family glycosyltransferase [Verrucomicrobiae bacterium]|nr:WecB/TagA/CpsF family glycosyltransferase [Verrucomicrobiae bacterium]
MNGELSATLTLPAALPSDATSAPVALLGVVFDPVTLPQTLQRIEDMIASRRPHYIATANMDFVVQARADLELRRILFEADLVLCDGTPLVWASRLLANPLPERVAGADMVPELIRVAAEKGYRLFLLGAAPEAAERAVANLRRQHPNLQIAGHYSPPFKPLLEMDHDDINRRIRDAKPDILLVSFGCPKQEKWISMNYQSLNVPVSIGVGATIDFLGGQMKRAPRWMQRSGLEWVYRLMQEPRRLFKRYAVDMGVFGTQFLCQWFRSSAVWLRDRERGCAGTMRTHNWQHVGLPAHFDVEAVRLNGSVLKQAIDGTRHCLLDLRQVKFIDSTGIAALMHLQRALRKDSRTLVLLAPSRSVRNELEFMRLTEFFRIAETLDEAQRIKDSLQQEKAAPVVGQNPIVWRGEITVTNADEVLTLSERCLLAASEKVKVDLSQVRFIDSTGAAAMRRLCSTAVRAGRQVVFTGMSPAVLSVLRCCRIDPTVAARAAKTHAVHNGEPERAFAE